MSDLVKELCDIGQRVVELARKHGADDAEVVVRDGAELTTKVRLGEPELVQEAGSRALGLRVFKDLRSAVTYTSDLRAEPLDGFVAETVTLAALSEPDELNRLPAREHLANAESLPDLDLWDESCIGLDAATALALCVRCEKAARDYDPRVTNSDGASFSRVFGASVFASSGGFVGGFRGTYVSLVCEPICDDADHKKRNGYWWSAGRFLDMLIEPEEVGRTAAERTVATLGPRRVETCEVPVIFDPEMGRSIVRSVFGVSNGSAMYRKSTYLLGREGSAVASPLITIVDDPLIPRAPGSRPFDGDGLTSRKNTLVREGVLETVLCDTYSARKLGRESTGSAGRGVGGTPGPTTSNLIMQPGTMSRDELFRRTDRGLYVTSMMGFGFNPVTGDYSRGASGFWIEDGEIAFPVSELTVSCNFDDLLKGIDLVADDIDRRASTACPTFRVAKMTVAGKSAAEG